MGHRPLIEESRAIKFLGQEVIINYLNFSPTERKVQHALGMATWYLHCFETRKKLYCLYLTKAPDPMTAVQATEHYCRKDGLIVYQIDEIFTE